MPDSPPNAVVPVESAHTKARREFMASLPSDAARNGFSFWNAMSDRMFADHVDDDSRFKKKIRKAKPPKSAWETWAP